MKNSSERNFGLFFSAIFFLIGLWPLLSASPLRLWSISLAVVLLALALARPRLLKPLNYSWLKLGEILGKIIVPIIMGLLFFIILTPISFFVRVLGKDLLRLKFSKNNTYWIKREKNITTMNKQF